MEALPGYKDCFVCGKDNPFGLNITFIKEKNKVKANFIPESKHQGFKGIVHGGILFSILDEIMGRAILIAKKVMTLTVEIDIKYRRKAKIGEEIIFTAQVINDLSRLIEAQAQVCKKDGTLLAEAIGKFIVLPSDMQKEVEKYLSV